MGIFKLFKRKTKKLQKFEESPQRKLIDAEDPDCQIIRLTKNNYSKLLDSPIPDSDQFKIIEVNIKNGEYFKANQTIFTLGSEIHGSGILYINLPFGGKLNKYIVNRSNYISLNDRLINVKKIEDTSFLNQRILDQNIIKLNQTEVSYL